MDEWVLDGSEVPVTHPLSFEKCDREMCFDRIDKKLRMPDAHLHFPKADTGPYRASWDAGVRCAVMQGGQGDVKHWAFNDPPRRKGKCKDAPPPPGGIPQADHARGGPASADRGAERPHQRRRQHLAGAHAGRSPSGPVETWKAEKVSIWHAGTHDNPFGQRLTCLMIAKRIAGHRRADVPAGRSSQRAVQLLPRRHRHLRRGDALRLVCFVE